MLTRNSIRYGEEHVQKTFVSGNWGTAAKPETPYNIIMGIHDWLIVTVLPCQISSESLLAMASWTQIITGMVTSHTQ